MQKYVGADITSMVTLPVLIFEPMTMLQKMAEVCLTAQIFTVYAACIFAISKKLFFLQLMEYSHLLELADECEDPHMRLVYTGFSSLFCTYKQLLFPLPVYTSFLQ